jgi:hypothetical protein
MRSVKEFLSATDQKVRRVSFNGIDSSHSDEIEVKFCVSF